MENKDGKKENGNVFYMREGHYLTKLCSSTIKHIAEQTETNKSNTIDPLALSAIVETIQNTEIDLKGKFKHWGVVIYSEREDVLQLGKGVSLALFSTNWKDSCSFIANNSTEKQEFFEEFMETFEQLVLIYTAK